MKDNLLTILICVIITTWVILVIKSEYPNLDYKNIYDNDDTNLYLNY